VFLTEIVDHGGRRGDLMRALSLWHHPVSSSEAQDVLYRAMCPALYRRIRMAFKIASNFPAFFVVVDLLLPANITK
jgi:hypothetical protein